MYYRTPGGRAAKKRSERNRARRRRGWSEERVTEFLALQDGRCAICRTAFVGEPRADHDHITGKPRGLLCHKCNAGLGMLGDSLLAVESAAAYLRRFV